MSKKKAAQPSNRRGGKGAPLGGRPSRRNGILFGAGSAVVVIALIALIASAILGGGSKPAPAAAPAPASPTPTGPVWPAPTDVAGAVKAAGLPMLTAEGTVEHIHAHLDVIVNGQPVTVPAGIGIDEINQGISPLHTHDTSGVIHIESPEQRPFTLGEVFAEWRLPLSPSGLGGLPVDAAHPLRVVVNGTPYSGDPAALTLNAHDEIAVVYGATPPGQAIPSHYDFPEGE